LRVLDHCAIYLLIAGTYTRATLVSMRGGYGWTLFGLAWGLAVVGIVFKVLAAGRFAVLSTVAYLLTGWLCIVAVKPRFVLLSPGASATTSPSPCTCSSPARRAFCFRTRADVGSGCALTF
jgi:hemolysin III